MFFALLFTIAVVDAISYEKLVDIEKSSAANKTNATSPKHQQSEYLWELSKEETPVNGQLLTTLDYSFSNFELKWDIIPRGEVAHWGSIVHMTAGGNCCNNARIPACWFKPASLNLICVAGHPQNGNDHMTCNIPFTVGHHAQVKVTVIDTNFKISVNGTECASKDLQEKMIPVPKTKVYVADPWHDATDSYIWNMRYTQL